VQHQAQREVPSTSAVDPYADRIRRLRSRGEDVLLTTQRLQ